MGRAVVRLKGVLKAFKESKTATARVAERRQAAGNGSPQRTGATGGPVINNMSDADEAYSSGQITHEQYVGYRKEFGLSLAPGGGR